MKANLAKILVCLLAAIFPVTAYCDDDPGPDIIPFPGKSTGKKKTPPLYTSYLTYADGEACFHSTQPYAYATIVVTDDTDSVIGSMIVSPEDNCGFLDLQSGCTITCTFDNGASVSTVY